MAPTRSFGGDAVVVNREAVLAFAGDDAAHPMHLDAAAARRMGLDDVTSSAAFTFAFVVEVHDPDS